MAAGYIIKEGLEGFRRARIASFISVTTVAFFLILVGIFLIITLNLNRIIDLAHRNVDMEIFIDNAFDDAKIRVLQNQVAALKSVEAVDFISREMAVEFFRKVFDREIFAMLDENSLPASFRVKLKKDFRNSEGIEMVAEQLKKLRGVDDVVYRRDLVKTLDTYASYIWIINIFLGVFVCLGSLFMISNTTRLIIMAKMNIIEAMALVGATQRFIRFPFLIEGLIQGALGGGIAVLVLWVLASILRYQFTNIIQIDVKVYWVTLVTGLFFGFLGSFFATTKFLYKSERFS